MSARVMYFIGCDNPDCDAEWSPPFPVDSEEEARTWFASRGWSHPGPDRDLCPDCTAGRRGLHHRDGDR